MDMKSTIRFLRKNPTKAEACLWEKLRNRKFLNLKFTRQYPIIFDYSNQKHYFVADFYCHNLKLVIELDGKIHDFQKERDQFRDYIIKELCFTILRFRNEEVFKDIDEVLKKISSVI